jgi:hypothetical protein
LTQPMVPPPVQAEQRTKVVVEFLDGSPSEELEAAAPIQIQGVFLLIPLRGDAWVGINMSRIGRWEARPAKISIARGMN